MHKCTILDVREMIKEFKDFEVYQTSYRLALKVHQISKGFPKHEEYEIGSQIRRAAISIPLNIAEGYGRQVSTKDFKRFLSMALGSSNEMIVLLDFIKDLGYLEDTIHQKIEQEYKVLGKRIYTLMDKWQ